MEPRCPLCYRTPVLAKLSIMVFKELYPNSTRTQRRSMQSVLQRSIASAQRLMLSRGCSEMEAWALLQKPLQWELLRRTYYTNLQPHVQTCLQHKGSSRGKVYKVPGYLAQYTKLSTKHFHNNDQWVVRPNTPPHSRGSGKSNVQGVKAKMSCTCRTLPPFCWNKCSYIICSFSSHTIFRWSPTKISAGGEKRIIIKVNDVTCM
jgi:hypothetical protein